MSKWRPTHECIYVIGDIHGKNDCLKAILKRITPLRPQDKLIFLGDYIDRGPDSKGVIDTLISLKKKNKNVIFIRGNHEQLVLEGLGYEPYRPDMYGASPYSVWMMNGGVNALLSYTKEKDPEKVINYKPMDADQAIPKEHIKFLQSTILCYETESYLFAHAGADPNLPASCQEREVCLWDSSVFNLVKNIRINGNELDWNKTIVTGHHYRGPYISSSFLMLDTSQSKKLLVVELNSMEGFYAKPGQNRLVKASLDETEHNKPKKQGVIRRIS